MKKRWIYFKNHNSPDELTPTGLYRIDTLGTIHVQFKVQGMFPWQVATFWLIDTNFHLAEEVEP